MTERPESVAADPPKGRCPICRRASDPVLRPFCSKRCADVDLHRWLSGHYRVETDDEPDEFDTDAPALGRPPE